MKYTMLYLKYLVVVLLLLLAVIGFVLGLLCAGLGIFGTAQECNISLLVFIPVGVFCGFLGFVALDAFKYLTDKWGLKDV